MRRVVITGLGAVSCLGNSKEDITESLRLGRSGIVANDKVEPGTQIQFECFERPEIVKS